MLENIVAFDPETGTVVGAANLMIVDLAALAKMLDVSVDEANQLLCDEDDDTQFAALQVGTPVDFDPTPSS